MYRILLFKFTSIDNIVLKEVITYLRSKNFEAHSITEITHLNASMFNWKKLQYDAKKIMDYIYEKYSGLPYDSIIGIGCIDAYTENEEYILSYSKGKISLIFTYRYRDNDGGADLSKFIERVKKEVLHGVGHTLGLKDCTTPNCVMREVKNLKDIDNKGLNFCPNCMYLLNIHYKS
ncbi:archaemetzincin [Stygiolobus caldivivus]|uniref:Archemetzincin n=1 Tax=Stygiolobus caldivivus TaxID=2824673 RepID=A0A8D5U7C6_9CREN|nr:archaemetzincin [Stygiolobus caldivivus]BCU70669.1 archemetzincin [Stygiolobus caldivivus]